MKTRHKCRQSKQGARESTIGEVLYMRDKGFALTMMLKYYYYYGSSYIHAYILCVFCCGLFRCRHLSAPPREPQNHPPHILLLCLQHQIRGRLVDLCTDLYLCMNIFLYLHSSVLCQSEYVNVPQHGLFGRKYREIQAEQVFLIVIPNNTEIFFFTLNNSQLYISSHKL